MFMLPSAQESSPGMSESKSHVSASNDALVPKQELLQQPPTKHGTLKIRKRCLNTSGKNTRSSAVQRKRCKQLLMCYKQITPLSATAALASCTSYDSKRKRWMKITDNVKQDFKQLVKRLIINS